MRAGAQSGSLTGIAPEPAQRLRTVGAQEILLDKGMNLQGLGEQGMGSKERALQGDARRRQPALQDPRRCRLAGGRDLWTPRLAQSGQTGSHPREEVFSPGVDTWRAEVPGSLCKACGCFSGTKSKAVSLRGNGLPDQPGKVTGGANSPPVVPGSRGHVQMHQLWAAQQPAPQPRAAAGWAQGIWASSPTPTAQPGTVRVLGFGRTP